METAILSEKLIDIGRMVLVFIAGGITTLVFVNIWLILMVRGLDG